MVCRIRGFGYATGRLFPECNLILPTFLLTDLHMRQGQQMLSTRTFVEVANGEMQIYASSDDNAIDNSGLLTSTDWRLTEAIKRSLSHLFIQGAVNINHVKLQRMASMTSLILVRHVWDRNAMQVESFFPPS